MKKYVKITIKIIGTLLLIILIGWLAVSFLRHQEEKRFDQEELEFSTTETWKWYSKYHRVQELLGGFYRLADEK